MNLKSHRRSEAIELPIDHDIFDDREVPHRNVPLSATKSFHSSKAKKWRKHARTIFLTIEGETKKVLEEVQKENPRALFLHYLHLFCGWIVCTIIMLTVFLGVASLIASNQPTSISYAKGCSKPVCNNDPVLCPGEIVCYPVDDPVFPLIDKIVVSVFTVEFLTRLVTVWAVDSRESKLVSYQWLQDHTHVDQPLKFSIPETYFRFILSFRSLVDLTIILPYYITLIMRVRFSTLSFVRVFRVFRVFRIFSIVNRFKRYENIGLVLAQTFNRSLIPFMIHLLCFIIFMAFFGGVLYSIESGNFRVTEDYPEGEYLIFSAELGQYVPSAFTSIPVAMYFVSTTITAVGYGDITAMTWGGRFLVCFIAYGGLIFLAIPTAVISINFCHLFKRFLEKTAIEKKEDEFVNDTKVSRAERRRRRRSLRQKHVRHEYDSLIDRVKMLEETQQHLAHLRAAESIKKNQRRVSKAYSRAIFRAVSRAQSQANSPHHSLLPSRSVTPDVIKRENFLEHEALSVNSQEKNVENVLYQSTTRHPKKFTSHSTNDTSFQIHEDDEKDDESSDDTDYDEEEQVTVNRKDNRMILSISKMGSLLKMGLHYFPVDFGITSEQLVRIHEKENDDHYKKEEEKNDESFMYNSTKDSVEPFVVKITSQVKESAKMSDDIIEKVSVPQHRLPDIPMDTLSSVMTQPIPRYSHRVLFDVAKSDHNDFHEILHNDPNYYQTNHKQASERFEVSHHNDSLKISDIHSNMFHNESVGRTSFQESIHSEETFSSLHNPVEISHFSSPMTNAFEDLNNFSDLNIKSELFSKYQNDADMTETFENMLMLKDEMIIKEDLLREGNLEFDDLLKQYEIAVRDYNKEVRHQERLFLTSQFQKPSVTSYEYVYDIFDCALFESIPGTIGAIVIYSSILLGVVNFTVSTLPSLRSYPTHCSDPVCNDDPLLCPEKKICPPTTPICFTYIDATCVIIYLLDYTVRLSLCWAVPPEKNFVFPYFSNSNNSGANNSNAYNSGTNNSNTNSAKTDETFKGYFSGESFAKNKQFSKLEFYIRYLISVRSVIDILCILPSAVFLLGNANSSLTTFMRTLRSFRIFKFLLTNKSIRSTLTTITNTLMRSRVAIFLMFMTSFIAAVFYGAIIYSAESGKFIVNSSYPKGYYSVPTIDGTSTEPSRYISMLSGIYSVYVTLAGVGFGDITPTTVIGRVVTCIVMLSTTVFLSLPIGIVQDHYQNIYREQLEKEQKIAVEMEYSKL